MDIISTLKLPQNTNFLISRVWCMRASVPSRGQMSCLFNDDCLVQSG